MKQIFLFISLMFVTLSCDERPKGSLEEINSPRLGIKTRMDWKLHDRNKACPGIIFGHFTMEKHLNYIPSTERDYDELKRFSPNAVCTNCGFTWSRHE